jgi:L-alanine-DL-glutamate epimerase-like enolase superfamily enzyme
VRRSVQVEAESFPIAGRFTIARGSRTEAVVVTATVSEGHAVGRGECVPYSRYGETVASVTAQIEAMRASIELGLSRAELQDVMPPGAARNAVDCALWDVEAKLSRVPAYVTAGLARLRPVTTAYTISLDEPAAMAAATERAAGRPLLKIKLGAPDGDLERIDAVRRAAPDATLIADANEGWNEANVAGHLEALQAAGFALVEQPLPAGSDAALAEAPRGVAICADESLHVRSDIPRLAGLYDVINIKLDKAGGLTEALQLAADAQRAGLGIMVGCMLGTSLGMAPAALLAPSARFVDLDGPLLLARDRADGLLYEGSIMHPPSSAFWG